VADRIRVARRRKRARARRPAKKSRKRRLGTFALALLVALIFGFLTKRMMIPSAVHYIVHRPPDQPRPVTQTDSETEDRNITNDAGASNAKSNTDEQGASENLTPGDRSALDALMKRKER